MIVKPQLGFTYDCPHCFEPVSGSLDIFALRAQKAEIACACGKSALTASITDNVLTVAYPCALCGRQHEASFLPERALSGVLCTLECPESGLPTGYVSTPKEIDFLNSTESDMMISEFIMHYLGIGSLTTSPQADVSIQDAQNFSLVECTCGCRNFSASYSAPYLRIICQNCGRIIEILSQHPSNPESDSQKKPKP